MPAIRIGSGDETGRSGCEQDTKAARISQSMDRAGLDVLIYFIALRETLIWWVTPSPRSTLIRYVPCVWPVVFQLYW
jgi:hypothetical protein